MFKITNLSNSPLALTQGRLAPGKTASFKTVGDRERSLEKRGWLRILEEKKGAEPKSEPKAKAKQPVETDSTPSETTPNDAGETLQEADSK